jgi:hypothetical protein
MDQLRRRMMSPLKLNNILKYDAFAMTIAGVMPGISRRKKQNEIRPLVFPHHYCALHYGQVFIGAYFDYLFENVYLAAMQLRACS